jgi:hypothetical protein
MNAAFFRCARLLPASRWLVVVQNNVLVHYNSCLQNTHVCPVTGVNFVDQYNESIANGGDGITYT